MLSFDGYILCELNRVVLFIGQPYFYASYLRLANFIYICYPYHMNFIKPMFKTRRNGFKIWSLKAKLKRKLR